MADTMKFLWGANSKIPASSSATNGKAYFAIIDKGYTDTAAPTNEAFIYLDKAGTRYNVIAKRAIFDSLGYKIVDKYFAVARNNSSNLLQFFAPSQNVNTATPVGSAAIITAIDLSNSSVTANEYKIKTIINGFEDKSTGTNSTLSLGMATKALAGLMSAGAQEFGGQKTFSGKVIINSDLDVNGAIVTIDGTTSIALAAPTITNTATTSLSITAPTTNITASSALNIVAPTAINGNTAITGTLGVTGVTSITNTTDATSSAGALKVTGGALISKKLYVKGIATFANTTDGSSSGGAVVVSGGAKIAKSVYIGNNLTVGATIGTNGITSSGQVFITSTNETALTENTGALLIGTTSGAHLSLDANEIQAKSSGTAATTLNLNPHGGVTQFGGAIYVTSTAEASLTSGTGGIRVGSTSGTHLAIDGNEIQAKSSATAASALYLNPHGGTIYANSGSLIIPVKAASYTSSTAGEIWIVA